MWAAWQVPPNTPRPHRCPHGMVQSPVCCCMSHCWSWAGRKVSHVGDICLWWFEPWPSIGLFIRNCGYAAPHKIRLLGALGSSPCSSFRCNTVLYKCSHLPMQGFIRLMNTAAVSADTDSASFWAVPEAYSLQHFFHCSPTMETAACRKICLPKMSVWEEAFLTQPSQTSLLSPANNLVGQTDSVGRWVLGEETLWLSGKQERQILAEALIYLLKEAREILLAPLNKTLSFPDSSHSQRKETFPILCGFSALCCLLNIRQHATYCSVQARDLCMASSPLGMP